MAPTKIAIGDQCPEFAVEFVGDKAGDYKSVTDIVAKNPAVVFDFYTNWCQQCPKTAKELDLVAAAGKIVVVMVNLEGDEDAIYKFISDHQLKHVQAHCCLESDDDVGSIFGIQGIPHKAAFLNGKLIKNGPHGTVADLCTELIDALEEGALGDLSELKKVLTETLAPAPTTASTPSQKPDLSPCGSEPQLPTLAASAVGDSASSVSAQWKAYEKNELLLRENAQRWVMFPIKYHAIWEMYKKHEASFWTAEEIDLSQDMVDFDKLTEGERHFLMHVLAFFAGSDGIVLENLAGNFCDEVQIPEARAFYGFQIAMENIHSETYSLLIDQYCRNDEVAKDKLFRAIQEIPVVAKKAKWAAKWMNSESLSFAERLVAFATVEGILFSGSFCAIYWLKKRGLMPGLTFSNELIARDEGLHADFACLLYSMLERPLPHHIVHDIIKGAVEVEREFICDALSCDLIGMNKKMMSEYIEFVADRLCTALSVPKLYNSKNPFDWMELISLQGKTNFFEKRVGDYQKAGLMAKVGETQESAEAAHTFSMDEDF